MPSNAGVYQTRDLFTANFTVGSNEKALLLSNILKYPPAMANMFCMLCFEHPA
jgi:hypothetical protein